jgi:tRNA pseudouridine55 synthase
MFDRDKFEAEGMVLSVDKPYRWTSTDVVRKVKALLRQAGYPKAKVGHAGTLDPLATGVLLVCVGRATKRNDSLQAEEKEYVAEIELGATTPSYDLEKEIDARYPVEHITEELLRSEVERMLGEQMQLPPIYSAKYIDGRRAYEYAREGLEVEIKRSKITIHEIEILEFELPRVVLRIRCSKGTYIRSIARDLGEALKSGAHLTGLRRTRSGNFLVEESLSLENVEKIISEMKQI